MPNSFIPLRLIAVIVHGEWGDSFTGDLVELYEKRRQEHGRLRAALWLVKEMFHLLLGGGTACLRAFARARMRNCLGVVIFALTCIKAIPRFNLLTPLAHCAITLVAFLCSTSTVLERSTPAVSTLSAKNESHHALRFTRPAPDPTNEPLIVIDGSGSMASEPFLIVMNYHYEMVILLAPGDTRPEEPRESFFTKDAMDVPMAGDDLTTLGITVPGVRMNVAGGSSTMNPNGIPGAPPLDKIFTFDINENGGPINNLVARSSLEVGIEVYEATEVEHANHPAVLDSLPLPTSNSSAGKHRLSALHRFFRWMTMHHRQSHASVE